MITCPSCGRPVPEGQRFCGNCGADVQSAALRAPVMPVTPTPFGYNQGADFLDATPPPPARPPVATLAALILGVALLCLCCGIAVGAVLMYALGPVPEPAPPPAAPNLLALFRL